MSGAESPSDEGAPTRPLHVVVVAYGSPELLAEALATLGGGFPVTVVDNASDAATAELSAAAGARYVDPGRNLGFAGGVNRALGEIAIPATDVLLLNPDARIEREALERLHDELDADPRLACVAPAHRSPGGERIAVSTWPWHTPLRGWAEALGLGRRTPKHTFLSGAVLLLSGRALAEVGAFDERFFLYAEEEDWQRRALRRGFSIRHCGDVVVVHGAGGTDTDGRRLQLRLHAATERYLRKWYGPLGWAVYRSGMIVGQSARAIARRGPGRRRARELAALYVAGPDRSARRAGVLAEPEGRIAT